MKKILVMSIMFALLFMACNRDSDDDDDTAYRIQPGDLTKLSSPATGGTVNGTTYNYAVLYFGTINNANYIGIAVSNNPDPDLETFNLKIYFQSDTIPSSIVISSANATATVNTYSGITGGSMTLTFGTPVVTGSYTTYPITSSGGPLDINGYTLSSINLTAIKRP